MLFKKASGLALTHSGQLLGDRAEILAVKSRERLAKWALINPKTSNGRIMDFNGVAVKYPTKGPCRDHKDLFGVSNEAMSADEVSQARKICGACDPVLKALCLEQGLVISEKKVPPGIWGGMTTRERKKLLRAREQQASHAARF